MSNVSGCHTFDQPTIDSRILSDLREIGDDAFLKELFEGYLSDAEERMAKIREAVKTADAAALGGMAHSLKGASSNVGAARLAAICRVLQDIGRGGSTNGAAELLGDLADEFAKVKALLPGEAHV